MSSQRNKGKLRYRNKVELYKLFSEVTYVSSRRSYKRSREYMGLAIMGIKKEQEILFIFYGTDSVVEMRFKDVDVYESFTIYYYAWGKILDILKTNQKDKEKVEMRFSRFNSIDFFFGGILETSLTIEEEDTPKFFKKYGGFYSKPLIEFGLQRKIIQYVSVEPDFNAESVSLRASDEEVTIHFEGKLGEKIIRFEGKDLNDLKYDSNLKYEISEFSIDLFMDIKSIYKFFLKPSETIYFIINQNSTITLMVLKKELIFKLHSYYYTPSQMRVLGTYEGLKENIHHNFLYYIEDHSEEKIDIDQQSLEGWKTEWAEVIELFQEKIDLYKGRIKKWKKWTKDWDDPLEKWSKKKIYETMTRQEGFSEFQYALSKYREWEVKSKFKGKIEVRVREYNEDIEKLERLIVFYEENEEIFRKLRDSETETFKTKDIIDYRDRGNVSRLFYWNNKRADEVREVLEGFRGEKMILYGGTGYRKVEKVIIVDEIKKDYVKKGEWVLTLVFFLISFPKFHTDHMYKRMETYRIARLRKVGINLGGWRVKKILI